MSRKKWTLRIAALGLGAAIVAGAELGLELAGYPAEQVVSTPPGWGSGVKLVPANSRKTYLVQEGDRVRTSERMRRDGFMTDLDFSADPVEGVTRIFTFGGSAALGVPIEREPWRSFPGRLHSHLKAGGMTPEVINLAGASFGSDQVVELASLAAQWNPDAFVVYSGNNEFFNYNIELYQLNWTVRARTQSTLSQLKLYQLTKKILGKKPKTRDELDGLDPELVVRTQDEIIAAALEQSLYSLSKEELPLIDASGAAHRRDPHHKSVTSRYEANLTELAQIAQEANIKLYIVEIPTHLLQEPELSLRTPGAPSTDALIKEHTLSSLNKAVERDPGFAQAWFELGRLEADSSPELAELHLRNASELDMSPGRPVEQFRIAIRELGKQEGVTSISVNESLGNIDAHKLYADACHLTAAGQDILAQEVAAAILKEQP